MFAQFHETTAFVLSAFEGRSGMLRPREWQSAFATPQLNSTWFGGGQWHPLTSVTYGSGSPRLRHHSPTSKVPKVVFCVLLLLEGDTWYTSQQMEGTRGDHLGEWQYAFATPQPQPHPPLAKSMLKTANVIAKRNNRTRITKHGGDEGGLLRQQTSVLIF